MLTKLDILNHFDSIKICTEYKKENFISDDYSEFMHSLEEVETIYDDLPGWDCDITGSKSFQDLPTKAQEYVQYLESLLKTKIKIVSIGPERNQIIQL